MYIYIYINHINVSQSKYPEWLVKTYSPLFDGKQLHSLDWFEDKIAGKPYISWGNKGFL